MKFMVFKMDPFRLTRQFILPHKIFKMSYKILQTKALKIFMLSPKTDSKIHSKRLNCPRQGAHLADILGLILSEKDSI